jgi:hypothetical protein
MSAGNVQGSIALPEPGFEIVKNRPRIVKSSRQPRAGAGLVAVRTRTTLAPQFLRRCVPQAERQNHARDSPCLQIPRHLFSNPSAVKPDACK